MFKHHVGFIEDDHLDRFEPQRAAPHVIHHAPRRADDDLRALLQARKTAARRIARRKSATR